MSCLFNAGCDENPGVGGSEASRHVALVGIVELPGLGEVGTRFRGTNATHMITGKYGRFTGSVEVAVAECTRRGWTFAFRYSGIVASNVPVAFTNTVHCRYSRMTRAKLDYLGSIWVRFLSDDGWSCCYGVKAAGYVAGSPSKWLLV